MDVQNYISKIKRAPSLWALRDAINEAEEYISQNDLGDLENYTEMSRLPTFGGEPSESTEIWSWDPEDLIMLGPDGDFMLVSREE
jgi:hypothetical protein